MSLIRLVRSPEIDPEPVSITEFLAHLHMDSSPLPPAGDLVDITEKLSSGRIYCENESNRAFVTSDWAYYLEEWPSKPYITLPLGNLQSVASIIYTTSDGVPHTWPASNYKLSRIYSSGPSDAREGRINLAYGCSWPSDTLDTGEPIRVEFTCGWLTADDVPAAIKSAIKQAGAHFYENREAVIIGQNVTIESKEVAMTVNTLMAQYVLTRSRIY